MNKPHCSQGVGYNCRCPGQALTRLFEDNFPGKGPLVYVPVNAVMYSLTETEKGLGTHNDKNPSFSVLAKHRNLCSGLVDIFVLKII